MPKTARQNELIREATRAKLLENAMQLYAEYGYAYTSIRKIAKQSDVSVGLLYHYFSNKEELLQAVFDNCMQIISAGFSGIQDVAEPLAKINFLVRFIFTALQADRTYWGLFYSLRSQPAVLVLLGDEIRLWTKRLRDLFITNFRKAGRDEPEADAYLLYSLIEGTIQQYLLEPAHYPLASMVERIVEQFGL